MIKNMKFIFVIILLVAMVNTVCAATRYVTDNIKITLRTGQGIGHKIVAMLESGDEVELLQYRDDWSRIRIKGDKEGWVLSRFLTETEPDILVLNRLKSRFDKLSAQADTLRQENKSLKAENGQLKNELQEKQSNLKNLTESYDDLKDSSSEFLSLKTAHSKATKELTVLTKKASTLEEELGSIQMHNSIRWFLSGGGVLIVGFIIGFSTKKSRRRSSLY